MVNSLFKGLFLIVLICLVAVLFGIYQKLGTNGRFQMSDGAVLDTKNGKLYFFDVKDGGMYYKGSPGNKIPLSDVLNVQELPRD